MAVRDDLIESIATTTADYREGDLDPPKSEHVDQWVNQFDAAVQLPILQEMDHVLKNTYISRKKTRDFLTGVFKSEKLTGGDPCAFWQGVKFLDIQGGGASQKEMLALFGTILEKECGIKLECCGTDDQTDTYIYLDDAIFSGGRVSQDLISWIRNDAPDTATVHVIVMANHQSSYFNRNKITEAIKETEKNIKVECWRSIELEDRKRYTDNSDVLRIASIPCEKNVQDYIASLRYPPQLRNPGQVGALGIFSTDAGRQLLEQEFLKAGVRIRELCPNLNQYQRPLGNMLLDTPGFGSLIVTFRNCPNNTPLALWAGPPWYPLFPRTTNSDTSMRRFMAMLAKDLK